MCPSGIPTDPTTTNPADCQNSNVVYLGWGTQQNVSPFDLEGGDDLGIYITASLDSGNTFAPPVRYSTAMGSYFQDKESAYEAQIVTRPDGTRFYGAWNQYNATTMLTAAEYASGSLAIVADPVVPTPVVPAPEATISSSGGGGCAYNPEAKFDPTLPAILAAALVALGLRRRKNSAN